MKNTAHISAELEVFFAICEKNCKKLLHSERKCGIIYRYEDSVCVSSQACAVASLSTGR